MDKDLKKSIEECNKFLKGKGMRGEDAAAYASGYLQDYPELFRTIAGFQANDERR